MNSFNGIGRLTREPELETTAGGADVCRLRMAFPRRRKRAAASATTFVTVVAFGGSARAAAEHLVVGQRAGVSGELEHSEWTDDEGVRHERHAIVADYITYLERPAEAGEEGRE